MPLRSLMHDLFPLIAEYGVFAVFASVFLTQAGAPLPAVPTLLVAGALSATGTLHWMELLPAALTGALLGDAIWYLAGQRYGRHVMALLCRLSLSPDSCVRRTRSQFERWGAPMLLIAKFVPGLSTVSSALLGTTRTPFGTFAWYDLLGSALWAGAPQAAREGGGASRDSRRNSTIAFPGSPRNPGKTMLEVGPSGRRT